MLIFNAVRTVFLALVLLSSSQVHTSPPAILLEKVYCSQCPASKYSWSSQRECYKVPEGQATHWCCKCRPGTFSSAPCRIAKPLTTTCTPCSPGTHTTGYNNKTECINSRQSCDDLPNTRLVRGSREADSRCVCENGTYSENPENIGCTSHIKCPKGFGVLTPGNSTHDVVCERCKDGYCSETKSSIKKCEPCLIAMTPTTQSGASYPFLSKSVMTDKDVNASTSIYFTRTTMKNKPESAVPPTTENGAGSTTGVFVPIVLGVLIFAGVIFCFQKMKKNPLLYFPRGFKADRETQANVGGSRLGQSQPLLPSENEEKLTDCVSSQETYKYISPIGESSQEPEKEITERRQLYEAILICVVTMGREMACRFFSQSLQLNRKDLYDLCRNNLISDDNIAYKVSSMWVSKYGSEANVNSLLKLIKEEKADRFPPVVEKLVMMLNSYKEREPQRYSPPCTYGIMTSCDPMMVLNGDSEPPPLIQNNLIRPLQMSPQDIYGDASSSMSLSDHLRRAIDKKLSVPSSQAKTIGQEGGSLTAQGCRLDVPQQAYEAPTAVSISVTLSGTRVPAGCIPISPEIECKSEFPFKGYVTITLPIYILPEEPCSVEIITKKDSTSEWEKLSAEITTEDMRLVKFKVPHFTKFWAIVRALQFWRTFLSHSLYFNSTTSSLCAVTCLDNESVIDDCHASLIQEGYKKAVKSPVFLTKWFLVLAIA